MNTSNTLTRLARTVTTVIAVTTIALTQPTVRTAEACGGYVEMQTPAMKARQVTQWYATGLNQRAIPTLNYVLAENAQFVTTHFPSGCCPPPTYSRATFLSQIQAEPRHFEQLVSLYASEDGSFAAEVVVMHGRQRFNEYLTIAEGDDGIFRITHLNASQAQRNG